MTTRMVTNDDSDRSLPESGGARTVSFSVLSEEREVASTMAVRACAGVV